MGYNIGQKRMICAKLKAVSMRDHVAMAQIDWNCIHTRTLHTQSQHNNFIPLRRGHRDVVSVLNVLVSRWSRDVF